MKFSIGEVAIVWQPTNSRSGRDMSTFHGVECEIADILPYDSRNDYDILVGDKSFQVTESELRKPPTNEEDDSEEESEEKYDGNKLTSWDEVGVWKPEREVEHEQ